MLLKEHIDPFTGEPVNKSKKKAQGAKPVVLIDSRNHLILLQKLYIMYLARLANILDGRNRYEAGKHAGG